MDSSSPALRRFDAIRKTPAVLSILLTFLLAFGFSSAAFAQVNTGQIAGTVTDPSGAVVPNATVTIKNLGTNAERTAHTSGNGSYLVVGLEPANYQVTVTSGNFQPYVAKLEVTVGGSVTLDAKLSVSGASTQVEVTAEGGVAVNTQTQELSQVVDTQQLAQLPSLTRNPYDFVSLSGNVSNGDNTTSNADSGQSLSTRGVGYAINGQRESGTEVLLDGVENISVFGAGIGEQIPIDAVQEYNIITNNFAAEYGRASGGVVDLTTKSGTNNLHGSAWEFNRLSAYTANTYDNDAQNFAYGPGTAPKGIYTRNQFGFAAGGPIVKNKFFLFASTEWLRVRSQASESELIPTSQFLAYTAPSVQSYFKAFGSTPYSPSSTLAQSDLGVTLPGVPASTPILGQVNFKANADAGGDFPQNTYRLLGRFDYHNSANTEMFFRYAREREDLFNGTAFYSAYPQYNVGTTVSNDSFLYSLSHSFGANIFSNTKLSFNRLLSPNSYDTTQQNVPGLMFGGASANGLQITFPGLENYMEPGAGGLPYGGPQNTVQVEDDLSWTKGNHSMKFGGQFTYLQMNVAYGAYAQAVEYLGTGLQTGLGAMVSGNLQYYEAAVNPQGKLPCVQQPDGTLTAIPSCEVTPPATAPGFARSDRYKDWAVYAQDSYRMTPRFTLNYGLRYEHYGVQHNDNQNLDSNFYYGSGSNIFAQVASGQVYTAPQSPIGELWKPRWGTAAPRVGFAYDVFGDGKTSLRGGFGISYERNFGNVTYNVIQNVPNYGVLQIYNTPVTNSDVGPLGTAGPAIALPPTELRNVNENINVAQTQFWSLSLQHSLSANTVLEASYSGAHGVHLYDIIVGNPIGGAQAYLNAPLTYNAACSFSYTVTNLCLTRPNAQYAGINIRGSGGSSAYDALNIKLQSENLHNTGLTLIANYTLAHSLDDLSSTFSDSAEGGSGYIGNLGYMDATDPMRDWGNSDYDIRNRFVFSPIWNTPWFKNSHSMMSEAAGGWSVSGIFTARTGTPYSAFDYTYNVNGYAGVSRIVPVTPVTHYKPTAATIVGVNQFQINSIPGANDLAPFNPTLGISDFGPFPTTMTARNAFTGPGAWNLDAAASKTFKIGERVGLEFRAEGFDVFNHHNLYVNQSGLSVSNTPGTIGAPLPVIALKGGLNTIALGGNHDERRFGQFALKATF
jgi:hypothetical protein